MDHDAVVIPGPRDRDFYPQFALDGMTLDETYIWGGLPPEELATSAVGHLQTILQSERRPQGTGPIAGSSRVERRVQKPLSIRW